MVTKRAIKIFLLVIVTAAVTAILLSPWLSRERFQSRTNSIRNDTVIDVDSIWKEMYVFNVPKTILVPSKTDTIYQERITKDSIRNDTTLQVTSKTYDIDNDTVGAHVVVSGINPNVDSITIWSRKITHTIDRTVTKTITKTIPNTKSKRLKIYPSLGVGYGVFGKKLDMYVGIGVTYGI